MSECPARSFANFAAAIDFIKRKAKAAAGFAKKFAQELGPGETVPDQTLALELAGRSVRRAYQVLLDADYAYSGHGVRRGMHADACRHTAASEIYPELRDVRREIEARFGRKHGRLVHAMEGHTRRKPKRQLPQLDRLVRSIKDRKSWPEAVRPGPDGEWQDWFQRLEIICWPVRATSKNPVQSKASNP